MKLAVVGLGYWGPNLLRNLVRLCGPEALVAVDLHVDRVAEIGAQYPGVTCRLSLAEALDKDDLDAVVLATPVSTHHSLGRASLEAGCHLLVEKPLAASSSDALALAELADSKGLVLMAGHTFLFSPRVETLADVVWSGQLGDIQYVTSSRVNLGLHQRDVGVIWDLAPHDFSILFHLLREIPVEVQTAGRSIAHPNALDVAFINMTFASGVVASVTVSWMAPKKGRSTVVVGDQQMLVYDDLDNDEPIRIYNKGIDMSDPENFGEHQLMYRHGDVVSPHIPAREPLAREMEHFLSAIEHGGPYRSDAWFGLGVVQALEAAEVSWHLGGRPVQVNAPIPLPRLFPSGPSTRDAAERPGSHARG